MFLSHYYPPEVNAPASRTSEHCREWARAGHDVVVVTCVPNHPSGKVYPGYTNRLFQSEIIDGVRIIRLKTFIAANQGFLLRTSNYLFYLLAVTFSLPALPKPDVVISTSPQFFCGITGWIVALTKRVPWVLEIRDLWPESILTVGAMRKGHSIRILEWLESIAYRQADAIVSVTNSFVQHIVGRGGEPNKITVIKNGVDLRRFKKLNDVTACKRELNLEGKFVAAYVGTLGMAHGLNTILDAAKILKSDPRIVFLIVGDGAERLHLTRVKEDMKLDNVVLLGQCPKESMPRIWSATDASLILLKRSDAFKKVIPSKMFEAMGMQCPIILAVQGEACELLHDAKAGISIIPENAKQLAEAVLYLLEHAEEARGFGDAGAVFVRAHYDRSVLAARYLELLEKTVSSRNRRLPVQSDRTAMQ